MENNLNIDNLIENKEEVAVETVETSTESKGKKKGKKEKDSNLTTSKIFKSTKEVIDSLNLEGRQQEQLDYLANFYKEHLESGRRIVREDVKDLDLTDDFNSFNKELNAFIKSLEVKVNKYITNAIKVNVDNTEKEFNALHTEFINLLEDVKNSCNNQDSELKAKDEQIEELTNKVSGLNSALDKFKELENAYKKIEEEKINAVIENNELANELKKLKNNYETDKNILVYKDNEIKTLESKIKFNEVEINTLLNKNKDLKIQNEDLQTENENLLKENKALEVQNAHFAKQNALLEKENKEIQSLKNTVVEKEELVTQLNKKNELLNNDLKDLNALKIKNIELEGSIKVVENQSKLLESTLNTVNLTISSLAEAKVKAEEKAVRLEAENSRLLKEIEELKKQLNTKK